MSLIVPSNPAIGVSLIVPSNPVIGGVSYSAIEPCYRGVSYGAIELLVRRHPFAFVALGNIRCNINNVICTCAINCCTLCSRDTLVFVLVFVFIKLHITAQSGPVIPVILCHSIHPPKGRSIIFTTKTSDQTRQRGHTLSNLYSSYVSLERLALPYLLAFLYYSINININIL